MSFFVFVEFGSSPVIEFLTKLRDGLCATKKTSPIHVTIRGPYAEPPPIEQLDEFADRLRGYGVKICDHGYFSTPGGFAVFLRAECSIFRELWDKPDYKVPLASIQPHITVFESQDRDAAQRVRNFLRKENVLIHTYNLYLSAYESKAKQGDLFGLPVATPNGRALNQDVWRVPDEMLERARELGNQIASSSPSVR